MTCTLVLLFCLFASSSGCAQFEQTAGVYQAELGRGPSRGVLVSAIRGELVGFGFQIQDESRNQFRTDWRDRSPSAAMEMSGVSRIRDAATVSYSARGTAFYVAKMRMEFQVRRNGRWEAADIPDSLKEEYRTIQRQIRQELEIYMTQD